MTKPRPRPPRSGDGLQRPLELGAVVAGRVVVGHRGHAVQALAVGRLDEVEADRLEEADRRPVVGPRGRPGRRRAARRGVAHEPRRELRSDAPPPVARIDGDHVEHRDRRVVLAQEADRDPDDPAVLPCRDPGRPREVPEPEPGKELPGGPAAGPVVEPSDDRVVVGVGRAAVVDGLGHVSATRSRARRGRRRRSSSTGTNRPWTSARYSTMPSTPPSIPANSQIPTSPSATEPSATSTAAPRSGRITAPTTKPIAPAAPTSPATIESGPPSSVITIAPPRPTAIPRRIRSRSGSGDSSAAGSEAASGPPSPPGAADP